MNSDTKKCPYCAEEIKKEAIKCKYCNSVIESKTFDWYRSRTDGRIAGVCSGLAKQFQIPTPVLRISFILATIFGGWGIVIYIILWIIMPKEPVNYLNATH